MLTDEQKLWGGWGGAGERAVQLLGSCKQYQLLSALCAVCTGRVGGYDTEKNLYLYRADKADGKQCGPVFERGRICCAFSRPRRPPGEVGVVNGKRHFLFRKAAGALAGTGKPCASHYRAGKGRTDDCRYFPV